MHTFYRALFVALWLAAFVMPARAQDSRAYPVKPVRWVTIGAGGALSASIVSTAAPDGYTLLFQSSQFAVNAALNEKLP